MGTETEKRIKMPPYGYASAIARRVGCRRETVWHILKGDVKSKHREKVEWLYNEMCSRGTTNV